VRLCVQPSYHNEMKTKNAHPALILNFPSVFFGEKRQYLVCFNHKSLAGSSISTFCFTCNQIPSVFKVILFSNALYKSLTFVVEMTYMYCVERDSAHSLTHLFTYLLAECSYTDCLRTSFVICTCLRCQVINITITLCND